MCRARWTGIPNERPQMRHVNASLAAISLSAAAFVLAEARAGMLRSAGVAVLPRP